MSELPPMRFSDTQPLQCSAGWVGGWEEDRMSVCEQGISSAWVHSVVIWGVMVVTSREKRMLGADHE